MSTRVWEQLTNEEAAEVATESNAAALARDAPPPPGEKSTGDVVSEIELPGGTSGAPMTYMLERPPVHRRRMG